MTVRLQQLTPDDLPVFGALLGRADFGGCFCAVWTHFGPDWAERCADRTGRPNFERTRDDVVAGRQAGFLVYDADTLVGWTGAGPREHFPALQTRKAARLSDRSDAWVLGCLAIPEEARGRGLADALVARVIDAAMTAGAGCIEAFPTRPWDEPRSYRGSERLFARHGFEVVASESDGDAEILLMRRELRPPA